MTIAVLGDSHLASVYSVMWLSAGYSVVRVPIDDSTSFLDALPVPEPGVREALVVAGNRYAEGAAGPIDAVHVAQDVAVLPDGDRDPASLNRIRTALDALERVY